MYYASGYRLGNIMECIPVCTSLCALRICEGEQNDVSSRDRFDYRKRHHVTIPVHAQAPERRARAPPAPGMHGGGRQETSKEKACKQHTPYRHPQTRPSQAPIYSPTILTNTRIMTQNPISNPKSIAETLSTTSINRTHSRPHRNPLGSAPLHIPGHKLSQWALRSNQWIFFHESYS